MRLSDILASIHGLSSNEKKQLIAILSKDIESDIEVDPDIFNYVLNEVGERMSIAKFSRSQLGPLWKSSQQGFMEVVNELIEGKTYRKVHILALKRFLLDVMFEDIRASTQNINIRTVCYALGNFSTLFERAYPGYSKKQLGPLIMSKLEHKDEA